MRYSLSGHLWGPFSWSTVSSGRCNSQGGLLCNSEVVMHRSFLWGERLTFNAKATRLTERSKKDITMFAFLYIWICFKARVWALALLYILFPKYNKPDFLWEEDGVRDKEREKPLRKMKYLFDRFVSGIENTPLMLLWSWSSGNKFEHFLGFHPLCGRHHTYMNAI